MASLGTLAAELKLEGAAGMISGLRGAEGAVSALVQTLTGARGPLARLSSAMQAFHSVRAGSRTGVAPIQAAGEAIRQLPSQTQRATAALHALRQAGALTGFADTAARAPMTARSESTQHRAEPASTSRRAAEFAGGLRGILAQFQAGMRGTGRIAGAPAVSGQRAGINSAAARVSEGDRLARVGGFIGSGGGPAVDYHRRTAAATEKSAQTLQTIAQHWAGPAQPQIAVWS